MKLPKRLLLTTATLLTMIAMLLYGWRRARQTPAYYHLMSMTAAQREVAAQSATNKLADLQNAAARGSVVANRRFRYQATAPSSGGSVAAEPTTAPQPITVSLTGEELNAFFEKWAVFEGWKKSYEPYVTGPVLILQVDHLIFAAKSRDLGAVASVEISPSIDEQGRLYLEITRVRIGDLPVPQGFMSGYRQRLQDALARRMPRWQAGAQLRDDGSANGSAIAAQLSGLLLATLNNEPGQPVIFLPVIERGSVPMRVTAVHVADDSLTLVVRPLDAAESRRLIEQIHTGAAPPP